MYFGKIEEEKIETPERFFKCLQLAAELYCRRPPREVLKQIIFRATYHLYEDKEIDTICSYANYFSYPYDFLIDCVNAPRDFFAHASAERISDFHIALALAVGDTSCLKDSRANCKRWCDNAIKRGPLECQPEVTICDVAGGTRTNFDYSLLDKEQKDS